MVSPQAVRIGFIDLDTSHAESFYSQLQTMDGVAVVAVCDSGVVRTPDFVRTYCHEKGCQECRSLEEMRGHVDAVMILSVNWDDAVKKALYFLEAGMPVMLDKPIAGNLADLDLLAKSVSDSSSLLFGGSGWRYAMINRVTMEGLEPRRLTNLSVHSPGPFFYYGIHAPEAVLGLLGPGVAVVEMREYVPEQSAIIAFQHSSDTKGLMDIRLPPVSPRTVLFSMDGIPRTMELTLGEIQHSVCAAFVEAVRSGISPLTPEELGESVRIMLAAFESYQRGGPVEMAALKTRFAFDGAKYVNRYKQQALRK